MKQRFQHIILLIILALAWSGETWGITRDTNNYEVFSKAEEFHVYSASTLSDYYSEIYTLNDVPGIIAFEAKGDGGSTGNNKDKFYVQVSTDKKNWSNLNSNELSLKSGTYQDFSFIITNTAVRYLRFKNAKGAKYSRYVRNLYVTRGKTLSFSSNNFTTSTTSIDFGSIKTGSSKKETVRLYYNNICKTNKLKLSSNNGNFIVPSNVTIESNGYVDVDVTFSPNSVGKKSGTVTLYLEAVTSYGQTISRKDVTISVSGTGLPFFGFSATANKIYNHGAVEATVNNSEIVGAVSDTQASTQATFTATPNANCTFEGWYEDAEHTKPASADNSYKNQTFKPTIINTSIGSTKTLTLYAYFKANQTLSWSNAYEPNVIYEQTSMGAATATASSGLTVSYVSNTPTVASVNTSGDVTGISVSPTAVTITASQAGNDEFYAATSISRSFTVISKYEASFEVDGFTGTSPTIHVDDTPTITLKDVDTDFTFKSSDPTVVGIARSGDVITLTALKVGTSTVTLTQPNNTTHSAAGATYNITVAKVPNNLAVSLASESAEVDGTIKVTFSDQNNLGTAIIGTIINQSLSSTVNNGTNVITYANGTITAKNAGTAKITFTQATTDKYAAFTSSTYTITVTKKINPITITLAGGSSTNIKLKYGATATLSYSSAHSTTSIAVNRIEGNYTTYSNGTITAGSTQGTDIYEITQPESYNYEAGYNSFTIRVNNSDEKDGYVLYDDEEHGWSTISSYTPAALSGPGDNLSYEAFRWWGGVNQFYVMVSKDNGSTWEQHDNPDLQTSYQSYPTNKLPDGVTNVKFETRTGATSEKRVKNIFVTRKTYVTASSDKTAFGTVYTDASPKPTATFTVNYSSTNGGNISISSNNAHFAPSISSISVESEKTATSNKGTTYICGVDGTQTFTVTYNPDPNQLGEESAVITVGDLFYSQQITLTATAAKHDNTLAVIGTQNLMVDDVVSNVYSTKNSNATLNYTLSREGVITYDPSTNKITAVGAGTATLTLTQAANDYYHATSKSVTVNVSKYDQTISWNKVFSEEERILEIGDVITTNTATASSGLDVTYSSSNSTALEVDPSTGKLTAHDGGANIVITATQPGNYKYNEVSITRYFTIIKRIDPTITTTLSEEETNTFPIGSEDITIRCNATITEGALTISGDEDAVSITFASNTFTLHALEEGTITLTLTRAQDEGFNAINKTYTIQVVKPVLALDPSSPSYVPDTYGTITLSRTFASGYSSLALPFSTTVAALTGRAANADDWVAQLQTVTYNAEDGYTLYFNKVTSGDITANQPYILHLGAAVSNPQWSDMEVAAAEEATVTASNGYGSNVGAAGTFADWSMSSNFEAGMSMSGKYGVVNSAGGLKRGGSTSTLNAFSAYITPPAGSAGVKLQSAFTDEYGNITIVQGVPSDDDAYSNEDLYDLSGRRLDNQQTLSRGIYIRNGHKVLIRK